MKYTKITALLLSLTLLCSCTDHENAVIDALEPESASAGTTNDAQTETITAAAPAETVESTASAEPVEAADDYGLPSMDGSTSATPLEIGLKSGFLDIPYDRAKELVSHTTTHDSFKRLINGEVDLIFSVPISEEQRKLADEAGVTLFMEPVAREGFVFVVNEENPVDSLTSEQLRKIYSGEITNWSEVGGNDEPILPYQRNTDSGSQNYMTVFMGETPLLPPKTELTAGMMMSLMDAIAVYDNSAGAIGYSVYSYAAQMYANANKVKFIKVDGVAPSKATMADESYPLLSCTYIIYTDRSPESAREFTEKVLSDEGQGYVLDSGYLPVNGMEVPEKYLPYEAVGTGEPKPADFTPSRNYSRWSFHLDRRGYTENADGYFELDFLADEELQARINDDIRAAMDEVKKHYKPGYDDTIDGINIDISCQNGYMSLVLGYRDIAGKTTFNDLILDYHYAVTLNYDLIKGTRIERFSDLFYEGEDFMPDVNQSIANQISREMLTDDLDYIYNHIVQKQDFTCILGEPRLFTIDSIGLEPDNPYFACAPFLNFSDDARHSIVSQYRDMSEIVKETYLECIYENEYSEWETTYTIEDGDAYKRITGSVYHTDEEVKADDELLYGLQRRTWETIRKAYPDRYVDNTDIGIYRYGNYYNIGLRSVDGTEPKVNFDADSLEIITMEMLLGENWRQYLNEEQNTDRDYIPSVWFSSENEKNATVYAYTVIPSEHDTGNRADMLWLSVPQEAINEQYRDSSLITYW